MVAAGAAETTGATSICEPWCSETCTALNGEDLEAECGACTPDMACSPGAVGYPASRLMSVDEPPHFLRAGSEPIRLQPWERERETTRRHRYCSDHGVEVLDANDRHFDRRIRALLNGAQAPLLVTGLLDAWPAPPTWTKDSLAARGEGLEVGVRPWNFAAAAPGAAFGERAQRATIVNYLDRWNRQSAQGGQRYVASGHLTSDMAAVFSEPNGVVFQNVHCIKQSSPVEAESDAYDHTVEALLKPVPPPQRL